MQRRERSIRILGYSLLTLIFLLFFMQELYLTWSVEYIGSKILLVAVLQTLIIWEPARYIIRRSQKRWGGITCAKWRISITATILACYACLIGFLRIWLEHVTRIWGSPALNPISIIWAMGVCLLFILLELCIYEAIYLFDEWKKTRDEAEQLRQANLQIQMDSLKVQIQPHFLFNTLNTLIALVEDAPRSTAVKYTEEIANVYRYLLVANEHPLIALREEMKFTDAYLFLIKTRYTDGLHISLPADEHIDDYETVSLAIQLLLENAVKHNIITRAHPLHIGLEIDNRRDRLTVTNNLQPRKDVTSTGKGLQQLKRKFELLNMPAMTVTQTADTFSVSIPLRRMELPEMPITDSRSDISGN